MCVCVCICERERDREREKWEGEQQIGQTKLRWIEVGGSQCIFSYDFVKTEAKRIVKAMLQCKTCQNKLERTQSEQ